MYKNIRMERNLTTGSVFGNVIYFSLPYLLSYFLQTLYGMADLFIIGQFEGVASTTAVSIGSQVMHMLTVMIVGLAMGSTVSIGQAIGGNDKRKASLDIGNTKPDMDFFEELVRILGLKERLDAMPQELSGGQKQQAAIARALLPKPALVLADEPTGNLDTRSGQNVLGLLRMMNIQYHQTLVMITHNLDIAQTADRIIRVKNGTVQSMEINEHITPVEEIEW